MALSNPARDAADLPIWLNIDKPTKQRTLHVRGGCAFERKKGSGPLKPVNALGRNGGWLPFESQRAASEFGENEFGNYLPLKNCSFCADAFQMADFEMESKDEEGAELLRLHRQRERSARIVQEKRRQVLKSNGVLACEVCDFDFFKKYGQLGFEFCEVHHLIPLGNLKASRTTTLDDLAIVCSNCHRMLHRTKPCLTLKELAVQLQPL